MKKSILTIATLAVLNTGVNCNVYSCSELFTSNFITYSNVNYNSLNTLTDIYNQKKIESDRKKMVVFNANDITELSNANYEQILEMLNGTNLVKVAGTFLEAEQEYGINAIALMSIASLESSYGNSCRALEDNNLTGYAVYTDLSAGRNFSSWEKCIFETAKLISSDYINSKGKWHTGTGKNLYDINDNYSKNSRWASQIEQIGINYANKINSKI